MQNQPQIKAYNTHEANFIPEIPERVEPYYNSKPHQVGTTHKNWLSTIKDDVYVHRLSIPGTHDTATYSAKNKPQLDQIQGDIEDLIIQELIKTYGKISYQCQILTLQEQLISGIRFFDMRVRKIKDKQELYMAHGPAILHPYHSEVKQIKNFLDKNPTQFVILHFQKQGGGDIDPLKDILGPLQGYYYPLNNSVPKVGDLRGKVWIWRNKNDFTFSPPAKPNDLPIFFDGGFGQNTTANVQISQQNKQDHMFLQNYYIVYEVAIFNDDGISIVQKTQKVRDVAFKVNTDTDDFKVFKVNFLSGCGTKELLWPYKLAQNHKAGNHSLYNDLKKVPNHGIGVTIMDFPGNGLIQNVINCNIKFRK